MHLGRLVVGKWCMLRRPLKTSLDDAVGITHCMPKLHNCCTDSGDVLPVSDQEAVEVLSLQFHQLEGRRPLEGQSVLRSSILRKVELKTQGRLAHCVGRNNSQCESEFLQHNQAFHQDHSSLQHSPPAIRKAFCGRLCHPDSPSWIVLFPPRVLQDCCDQSSSLCVPSFHHL